MKLKPEKLLYPLRYIRMVIKLSYFALLKGKKRGLSEFSYVPQIWRKSWENVKEADEQLLWSSVAFSGNLPSLNPYTQGWLIISDRGIYFAYRSKNVVRLLFRRGNPPFWKWVNLRIIDRVSFFFEEGEEWKVFIGQKEDLFRARLFRYEAKEKS